MTNFDQIRAVVFDVDGTLLDTLPSLAAAANQVLVQAGFEALPVAALRGALSEGLLPMFRQALSLQSRVLPPASASQLEAQYLSHYVRDWLDTARLYPQAGECLAALQSHGLRLAICTNRDRASTEAMLRSTAEAVRFEAIVGLGDAARRKPAPDPLLQVLQQLQLRPTEVLFVGDSLMDSQCAEAAGVPFAAHLNGYASAEGDLWPRAFSFRVYEELTRRVLRHLATREALHA